MTRVRSTDLDPLTNSVAEEDMNGNQCYYRYDCTYSNVYCNVSLKCHEKVPKEDKIIRSATTEIKSVIIFKKRIHTHLVLFFLLVHFCDEVSLKIYG